MVRLEDVQTCITLGVGLDRLEQTVAEIGGISLQVKLLKVRGQVLGILNAILVQLIVQLEGIFVQGVNTAFVLGPTEEGNDGVLPRRFDLIGEVFCEESVGFSDETDWAKRLRPLGCSNG
ncbi:hypothetical protein IMZ48_31925 [Candidatus Bathyarchaeota archaeon]|nr:hypothetical protein [Candidatus Bathyarchaeota archaeon]